MSGVALPPGIYVVLPTGHECLSGAEKDGDPLNLAWFQPGVTKPTKNQQFLINGVGVFTCMADGSHASTSKKVNKEEINAFGPAVDIAIVRSSERKEWIINVRPEGASFVGWIMTDDTSELFWALMKSSNASEPDKIKLQSKVFMWSFFPLYPKEDA